MTTRWRSLFVTGAVMSTLRCLVGVALVSALVLPSAVQAQGRQPRSPTITYTDNDQMSTMVRDDVDAGTDHTYWVFTVENPSGGTVTVRAMENDPDGSVGLEMFLRDAGGGGGHGEWEATVYSVNAAGQIGTNDTAVTRTTPGAVRVYPAPETATPGTDPAWVAPINSSATTTSPRSDATLYTHGRPPAPKLFEYSTPAATVNLFTWTDASSADTGITGYRLSWTADDPESVRAKWYRASDIKGNNGTYRLSSSDLEDVEEGTEYTFRLVALGVSSFVGAHVGSDNKVAGESSDIMVTLGQPSSGGTTPTPALPVFGAFALGAGLLAAGRRRLRRQQLLSS
jgi:hypothetical protein